MGTRHKLCRIKEHHFIATDDEFLYPTFLYRSIEPPKKYDDDEAWEENLVPNSLPPGALVLTLKSARSDIYTSEMTRYTQFIYEGRTLWIESILLEPA